MTLLFRLKLFNNTCLLYGNCHTVNLTLHKLKKLSYPRSYHKKLNLPLLSNLSERFQSTTTALNIESDIPPSKSEDPDQTAPKEQSDQGLYSLLFYKRDILPCYIVESVNCYWFQF